jgi:Zn-finger nucleic acid-binding protein
MAMLCPACGHPLDEQKSHGIALHGCTACGGVWLDTDQARAVTTRIAALRVVLSSDEVTRSGAGHPPPDARTRRCPLDAEPLTVAFADGVEVDVCPRHGTWFDAGEVRRIANAHLDDGDGPVADRGSGPDGAPSRDPLSWIIAFVGALFELETEVRRGRFPPRGP